MTVYFGRIASTDVTKFCQGSWLADHTVATGAFDAFDPGRGYASPAGLRYINPWGLGTARWAYGAARPVGLKCCQPLGLMELAALGA
jgi:hypothetical protein